MITREHLKGDAPSVANYSDCEKYRYDLTRVWDENGKRVMFLMLNPSTATEVQNDPTVERCERRARTLGYGAFRVCNIFAYRATDPKVMRSAADPVGPENDQAIRDAIDWQMIWLQRGVRTVNIWNAAKTSKHCCVNCRFPLNILG